MTGAVDGGRQTGGSGRLEHFDSQPDQTWSATAYLRLIHDSLFGLAFDEDRMRPAPSLPEPWGPVSLRGLSYRGMTLDIRLTSAGSQVRACAVDGRPGEPALPATGDGHHSIHLTLGQ